MKIIGIFFITIGVILGLGILIDGINEIFIYAITSIISGIVFIWAGSIKELLEQSLETNREIVALLRGKSVIQKDIPKKDIPKKDSKYYATDFEGVPRMEGESDNDYWDRVAKNN